MKRTFSTKMSKFKIFVLLNSSTTYRKRRRNNNKKSTSCFSGSNHSHEIKYNVRVSNFILYWIVSFNRIGAFSFNLLNRNSKSCLPHLSVKIAIIYFCNDFYADVLGLCRDLSSSHCIAHKNSIDLHIRLIIHGIE